MVDGEKDVFSRFFYTFLLFRAWLPDFRLKNRPTRVEGIPWSRGDPRYPPGGWIGRAPQPSDPQPRLRSRGEPAAIQGSDPTGSDPFFSCCSAVPGSR